MTTPTVLSHSWKPRTTEEPEQEETHKDHRAQPHAGPSKIQTFCSRALSTRSSSSLIPVPSALPWGPGLPPPPGRASPPRPQPLRPGAVRSAPRAESPAPPPAGTQRCPEKRGFGNGRVPPTLALCKQVYRQREQPQNPRNSRRLLESKLTICFQRALGISAGLTPRQHARSPTHHKQAPGTYFKAM